MKVLLISHMYPHPACEHYGSFVHEGARALSALGLELRVVAPLPWVPPGGGLVSGEWRVLAALPRRRRFEGLDVEHPRYLHFPRGIDQAGDASRLARSVMALPDLGDCDLIHAHCALPDGAAARRIAERIGRPYLITSHGSDVIRGSAASRAAHGEIHDAFRHAAAVLAPSQVHGQRIAERGLPVQKLRVLWNGFDAGLFHAQTPPILLEPRLRVACVADLIPSKGVELLVRALGILEHRGLACELLLVGNGPQAPRLRHLAAQLGLKLSWHRALSRADLAKLLREADVFALPAREESFGIVYLEAMASGLPVLAPAGEGIAELLGDLGTLVPEPDAGAWAQALARLHGDPDLRRRLGEAGIARARDLDWSHHARALAAIYEEILGRKGTDAGAPAGRERVFHLLYCSEPDRNGYALRSRYLMRAQSALGWQVQASTGPWQGRRYSRGPRETAAGLLYHRLDLPFASRRHGRLGWRRYFVFLQKALADRLLAGRLASILRREQAQILHAHSPAMNFFLGRRAARKAGLSRLPLIYEVRGLTEDTAVLAGNAEAGGLFYRIKRRLEEKAMGEAHAVVTLGEGLRRDFVARGVPAEKIHLVPNGVDCESIRPPMRDEALARELHVTAGRTLGYIGSMGRLEGLPWLVDRLGELPADWRLILVGEGEDRETILDRARELGLAERVIAPGSVPHATVARWYGLLDYFVLPRLTLRVTELVTPLKPLEAMAAGRIVLASDIGGHREILVDGVNGFLFRREDPAAFLARLAALDRAPAERARLAAGAREWVRKERDWRLLAARYEAVYAAARTKAQE